MKTALIALILFSHCTLAGERKNELNDGWKALETDYEKSHRNPQRYVVGKTETPWFPESWPALETTSIVRYLYAFSDTFPPSITDGKMIIAPWAEINSLNESQKIITDRLEDIGIQGVRPLTGREKGILESAPGPDSFFSGNMRALKEYYLLWIRLNGVLWERIRHRHLEFDNWLKHRES